MDVGGDPRVPKGTQQNGVEFAAEHGETVHRNGHTISEVTIRAPVEFGGRNGSACSLQNAQSLGDDVAPDTVPWKDGNAFFSGHGGKGITLQAWIFAQVSGPVVTSKLRYNRIEGMPTTLEKAFGGRAHMGQYAGVATPAHFGDVRAEYDALRHSAAIFDLNWRAKLALTGGDRVRWLNGMVTNNIRDLAAGCGVYAFLLNPQGKILGDMFAYNLGDSIVVDTDRSQREKIVGTFDHYIIMDDVEVADLDERYAAFGVAGPEAKSILEKAGFAVPTLQSLQIADVEWHGHSIKIVRSENQPDAEFELWFPPEIGASLWEAIANAGAQPVGSEALELLRITRGIPRYGQDIRERDLPQETEQQRALNFNKGCYVGQEIVERIRSRGSVHRKFTGFLVEGSVLTASAKIEADDKEVGEITSSAALPTSESETVVALGYIRREIVALKKDLHVGGTRIAAVDLPFADRLSA